MKWQNRGAREHPQVCDSPPRSPKGRCTELHLPEESQALVLLTGVGEGGSVPPVPRLSARLGATASEAALRGDQEAADNTTDSSHLSHWCQASPQRAVPTPGGRLKWLLYHR